MSRNDLKVHELEASLALNRMRLSSSVTELAERLRPAKLIDDAIDRVGGTAAKVAGDALEGAKTHAGKATLLAAGGLMAFDLGRRSSAAASQTTAGDQVSGIMRGSTKDLAASHPHSIKEALRTIAYWGGGAAAAGLGYAFGGVIPVTKIEKDTFGDAPNQFKSNAAQFWSEHSHGAKAAAAESFGIARLAATGLGLMAAMTEILQPEKPC